MARTRADHPSANDLAEFGHGKLPRAAAECVADHLADCLECQAKLAEQQPDSFVAKLRAAKPKDRTAVPGGKSPPPLPLSTPTVPHLPPELAALNKFEVIEKLGEGGMGAVWKAKHKFLGSTFAVKVMSRTALSDDDARHRFLREMRAAGKLAHPNIVKAHDAEEAGSLLYLVMEYIEGISLDKLVAERGALPVPLACRFAAQAAQGLRHAHEKGMAHRDIKPANLIVAKDGTVKVLDFGLARIFDDDPSDRRTRLQVFMGTADYVAPEQALNAREADARSDLYSLGCTLYFLLSGKPPFSGESIHDVAAAHVTQPPPPLPGLPPALWAVIARLLAKKPEQRFQTAAAVVAALAAFYQPTPRPRPRWPVLLAGVAAAAIIGATLLVIPSRPRRDPAPHPTPPPFVPPPQEFTSLFNGKDLTGWKTHPNSKSNWVVKDGVLVTEGRGWSFLFTERADFENVHVKARCRVSAIGNSGLFARKSFDLVFKNGYQLEIATDNGVLATGRILGGGEVLGPRGDPVALGDWMEVELIATGYQLTAKVNGKLSAKAFDSQRRFSRGRIAVELAPAPCRVEYSKIDVMELPSEPQLLRNESCEEELINGKIPGWAVIEGKWEPRHKNPLPHHGKAYFFAGECARAELRQDVNLSRYSSEIDDGRLGMTFEAQVCNFHPTNPDTSRIVLEYLDAAKEKKLKEFNTGVMKTGTTWQPIRDACDVPKGTRWVRVRLFSYRNTGDNNDGYFDSLWLKADVVPPPR